MIQVAGSIPPLSSVYSSTSYRRQALSKLNQHGNFQKVMMESYWTFFHKNFFGSSLQVFLTSDEVGSIYVDFSSYNYETQMMMISKLFTFKYFYIFEKTLTGLDGFSSAQQQEPVKIHLE